MSRPRDRVGVVDPTRPERSDSLTPPVASRRLAQHPEFACECQNPLPHAPPKSAVPRTRSVFHQQVPPSRPALTELLCVDRHRYRRLVANGPTSDMLSRPNPRSARPSCLPAIHRGRRATCRLPASAMYCSPSTPSPCPTSDGNAANRFPPDGSAPFEPPPAELPQVRGHLACFTAPTPIACDRSPRWIYPNLTGSSTFCHETVPRWKWNTASTAVLR